MGADGGGGSGVPVVVVCAGCAGRDPADRRKYTTTCSQPSARQDPIHHLLADYICAISHAERGRRIRIAQQRPLQLQRL